MESRFDVRNERDLTMLVDFYELTMGNSYLEEGVGDQIVYFDMYFRRVPDGGGYCVMAGVDQLIEYLENLGFTPDDIDYLRSLNTFSDRFLNYLSDFTFSCDVWAIPEGYPVFPNEPLVTVRGPAIQAQLLETMILVTINHQTLIATKASRICRVAGKRPVMEFGSRRAQGYDGAIYGARAAIIGGCAATANTLAGMMFDIPVSGTMAHSWVQLFDSELEAFRAWARAYPDNCLVLIDTYNVLKSGLPNAIKVFKELRERGHEPLGIRIDSGDITYLTRRVRQALDEAGFPNTSIVISNALDEHIIKDVLAEGAQINAFGVGERLITAKSEPVFGGVYKLVAVEKDGQVVPRIKISENQEKITNPGFKKIYRVYEQDADKAIADLICNFDETIDTSRPLTLFDPVFTWKKKTLKRYKVEPLRRQIFENGRLCYKSPKVLEIRDFGKRQLERQWEEVLRFENPHNYYVDLSQKVWDSKYELLNSYAEQFSEK
ncbi:nicotinate phosphoribosyltransferase [Sporolactobacillus spathodeae]|uniref:Nicotinate phosphoribosyltransferase n=1 Tax=Sporolactobacillus spathodeae TaxID=1465502 RepID=A0ABS2Q685_9BACL|nr:nicotinate phosphoribosyltransferase [Sporolactobacillus spathodeae]MBM7657292.1 nicotinate phosphoribosyltransferase [Sporolactobacillus spathodeae]